MKTDLRPYARPLDLAPADPQRLPAPVDGQLHLPSATYFFLGAICGAGLFGTFLFLIRLFFF